jgi:hypothetical protein
MTLLRTAVVLAVLLLSSARAWSQGRTDVIQLANGDRITGEVSELVRGRLEFKTDDVGTIYIEWDKVVRVQAARGFEVTTSDGRRFLGSLSSSGDRSLVVVSDADSVTLTMEDVTGIAQIGRSFWAKLDGTVDAGFSYTKSSGIAQTTFNSNTVFRRPAFEVRLTASATLTQQDVDDQADDRGALEASYLNHRGRRWFVGGAGSFETNESLGLRLRSQVGGMVGMRLVNTNRAYLQFSGGLVVNDESSFDTESSQNVEGLVAFRTSYYAYDRPKTNVDASLQYYPSLSDWGRQRLQLDTAFNREVWKDFFVGFHVYDTFDSDPLDPDAARNDVGIVASIGWSY